MHEEGFKKALTNVLNRYARSKGHLKEKDENLLGEDIREGLTAIISVKLRNPQFEGQTKTKLGNTEIRSFVGTRHQREARRLARGTPRRGQGDGAEVSPGRARTRRGPGGARPHAAQVAARVGVDAGQARRLLVAQSRRVRAVHRRGRQRRRERQEGARSTLPGDPPDPRQDPQRRTRPHRQDVAQRRDPDAHLRERHRPRRGVRPHEVAVPQDHRDDRRRRRRQSHPHIAADVLLSPAPRARARRPHLHRATAALQRQDRQGRAHLPEGRSASCARSRRRTRAARSRSAGSRVWARWTGRSSATPR